MAALAVRAFALARAPTGTRSMATGVVKWFNAVKGFGFITPDDKAQPDLFVHHSAVQSTGFRALAEGAAVKFDVQNTDKGPQAANVTNPDGTPITPPPPASNTFKRGGDFRGPRREGGGRRME